MNMVGSGGSVSLLSTTKPSERQQSEGHFSVASCTEQVAKTIKCDSLLRRQEFRVAYKSTSFDLKEHFRLCIYKYWLAWKTLMRPFYQFKKKQELDVTEWKERGIIKNENFFSSPQQKRSKCCSS